MGVLATIIDVGALWKSVAAALGAAIGITLIFCIALLGAARSVDLSRSGRSAAAAAFGTLAVAAAVAFIAAIVAGIAVMATK